MKREGLREVDLHLTNRCNLTCAHCSVDSGPGRSAYEEIALEDWMAVVDDAAGMGCRYCDLTGGEPVLYPGVERLIQHILAAGLRLELQSNGMLLSEQKLEQLRGAGLQTLIISVDGWASRHDLIRGRDGVYGAAIQAIRTAVAMGFSIRVTRVAIAVPDTEDIESFARELESLKVSHLSLNLFSPVTPAHFRTHQKLDPAIWMAFIARVEEVARRVSYPITYEVAYARPEELADYLNEETRCLIERRRWLLIRADGEVFPCYHFVHSNRMSIGNVRKTPLSELVGDGNTNWDSYRGLREIPTACSQCQFAGTCGGGCPSPGFLNYGSLNIKDVRCQVENGFIPVCPFIKRTAGTRHMTNIAPYYHAQQS